MVTIIASVKVKEGKMEEAIEILKEIVPKVKENESGTLEYIAHTVKGVKEKRTILFYEKYADDQSLKKHMQGLMKTMEKLTPLLEPGIIDMKTCFEIV